MSYRVRPTFRHYFQTLVPTMARQEGRISFGGEHTNVAMDWMEGGARSAIRVVQEAVEGLLNNGKSSKPVCSSDY